MCGEEYYPGKKSRSQEAKAECFRYGKYAPKYKSPLGETASKGDALMKWSVASLGVLILLGSLSGCRRPPQEIPVQVESYQDLPLTGVRVLMVVPPNNFRYEVFSEMDKAVTEAGGQLDVCSLSSGTVTGTKGRTIQATLTPEDVNVAAYAAVVFGGGPGIVRYTTEEDLADLARAFYQSGRYVAAMRVSQEILAHAGLLEGKAVAGSGAQLSNKKLEEAGAKLTSRPVEVDGLIITAREPKAAAQFAQELVGALKTHSW